MAIFPYSNSAICHRAETAPVSGGFSQIACQRLVTEYKLLTHAYPEGSVHCCSKIVEIAQVAPLSRDGFRIVVCIASTDIAFRQFGHPNYRSRLGGGFPPPRFLAVRHQSDSASVSDSASGSDSASVPASTVPSAKGSLAFGMLASASAN